MPFHIRQQKFHVSSLPALLSSVLRMREVAPRQAPSQAVPWCDEYTLLCDLPLPQIIKRKGLTDTGVPNSKVAEEDISATIPEAIAMTQKTYVTMAFVEWIDRKRHLGMNTLALCRDVASAFLDGLIAATREGTQTVDDPGQLFCLLPSKNTLERLSSLCLAAFVPAVWTEHLTMARKLDGGGLWLDAEFKMAKRIVAYVSDPKSKLKATFPFPCSLACRGVRGLYLYHSRPMKQATQT
jgi:hypothetical protein